MIILVYVSMPHSTVQTHAGLLDPKQLVHVGPCHEPALGSHSVLVVGWRQEKGAGSGNVRLLVQNWWHSKQFFEVDVEYLASRGAHLTWVIGGAMASVASHFRMVHAIAAQCTMMGDDISPSQRYYVPPTDLQ